VILSARRKRRKSRGQLAASGCGLVHLVERSVPRSADRKHGSSSIDPFPVPCFPWLLTVRATRMCTESGGARPRIRGPGFASVTDPGQIAT
jgi:hypothetical protein